ISSFTRRLRNSCITNSIWTVAASALELPPAKPNPDSTADVISSPIELLSAAKLPNFDLLADSHWKYPQSFVSQKRHLKNARPRFLSVFATFNTGSQSCLHFNDLAAIFVREDDDPIEEEEGRKKALRSFQTTQIERLRRRRRKFCQRKFGQRSFQTTKIDEIGFNWDVDKV
ncbi:hypothetical protein LINGRAHAP2_LOCUS25908, partial [Linum grandiflorum]